MGCMRKGLRKECPSGALMWHDGRVTCQRQVMGGTPGRVETGAQWKGDRLDNNRGSNEKEEVAGRNPGRSQRCQPEGTSEIRDQPGGAEA